MYRKEGEIHISVCVSVSLPRPLPAKKKVFYGERENGLEPRKQGLDTQGWRSLTG